MALRLSSFRLKSGSSIIVSRRIPKWIQRQRSARPQKVSKDKSIPDILHDYRAALKECSKGRALDVLAQKALDERHTLLPIHVAEILKICAKLGYKNERFISAFSESIADFCDLKSIVTAIIAVHRLKVSSSNAMKLA
jgi:hypothetical protein